MKTLNKYLELAGIAAAFSIENDISKDSNFNYSNEYKPSRNRTKAQNKRRAKSLRGRKARKLNFGKS